VTDDGFGTTAVIRKSSVSHPCRAPLRWAVHERRSMSRVGIGSTNQDKTVLQIGRNTLRARRNGAAPMSARVGPGTGPNRAVVVSRSRRCGRAAAASQPPPSCASASAKTVPAAFALGLAAAAIVIGADPRSSSVCRRRARRHALLIAFGSSVQKRKRWQGVGLLSPRSRSAPRVRPGAGPVARSPAEHSDR